MRKLSILLLFYSIANLSKAQLVINGGTITLGANSSITVQGDLSSTADIAGTGKIIMSGSTSQQMNMNGFTIPNLEINSTGGVVLAGPAKISSSLTFSAGKIQTSDFNLTLTNTATVTGAATGKFVETNGNGQLRKEITTAGNYDLPIGAGTNYMPLQYQVTGGTIAAGAYVGAQLLNGAHPNKPIRATDYITAYWKPAYSGLTGSTINIVGSYNDASGIAGDETLLNGIRYDGNDWSLASNTINTTTNTVTYNNVTTGTDLYAMNKFLLVNTKVFLQGAYNAATGRMSDNLRQSPNLIPLTDPYRSTPYNTSFVHTNNPVAEVADATVFNTKANDDDNIVDWVFLELRNSSNTLIQTRSALLQKDGDIVDVDGATPVFFKNLDAGNYVVTVRHRNHLGLAADASTNTKALSVARPAGANIFDLRVATDAQLYGDANAFTTSTHPTLGTINMLWSGNVNSNTSVRYTGPGNDDSYLLTTLLGSDPSSIITAYSQGDLNLNRTVRYTGPGNDNSFLLTSVLAGNPSTIIFQQIP